MHVGALFARGSKLAPHAFVQPIQCILVATDFSPTADAALDWAVMLARTLRSQLVLAHCYLPPPYLFPNASMPMVDVIDLAMKAARKDLDALARSVEETGLSVRTVLRYGAPGREIEEACRAEEVDLVVMGTHGHKGVARFLLGSVAERVVRTAPCSVFTVGPPAQRGKQKIEHILVGTDFSRGAERAIDSALDLAERVKAEVTIVHAYEVPPDGFPASMHFSTADALERYERWATDALRSTAAAHAKPGLSIKTVLRTGRAWEEISAAAIATDADLVVVGAEGRGRIGRMLVGSVAERVVRTSPRPVFVARPE